MTAGISAGRAAAARRVRLLALGNELLADDAFGLLVAAEARAAFRIVLPHLEVVDAASGGLSLLDLVLDVDRLLVVDTVATGTAAPGTIHVVPDGVLPATSGPSPHYTGLWEVLALGRALGLSVPAEVVIIAVEAADCTTVGGAMHPAVRGAIPRAVRLIGHLARGAGRHRADHPANREVTGRARTRAHRKHPEDRAR